MSAPLRYAVLTISDRCVRGEATDEAGPALCTLADEALAGEQLAVGLVPDEQRAIADQLRTWAGLEPAPDLILTTGGTGLGPRDVTPEATRAVIQRLHPGLMELARAAGAESTTFAYLSRGVAGTIGGSLPINLPGSTRGATESLEALVDILPHAIDSMRGAGHGRPYDE